MYGYANPSPNFYVILTFRRTTPAEGTHLKPGNIFNKHAPRRLPYMREFWEDLLHKTNERLRPWVLRAFSEGVEDSVRLARRGEKP